MTIKGDRLTDLTRAVRGAFNRLKALGDGLHKDAGITAAMRAVMETIYEEGEMTVPQIAAGKGVTRQHIQILADSLCAAGLAETKDNPAHRRSLLIALTPKGVRAFDLIREREAALIDDIARGFDAHELAAAADLLSRLVAELEARLETKEPAE